MKEKVDFLRIANIILIIVAILLILNMFIPLKPVTGGVVYSLDNSEPACLYVRGEDSTNITDIDLCCSEIQKLLKCEDITDPNYDKICYTSKNPGEQHYFINSKTYNYCIINGFAVEKK